MGHEVEHRRGVVSAVSAGGVHLHPVTIHGLHLFVAGLGTDANAAADVFPRGFRHAPVVVHRGAGLIVVRIFMVCAVCPHTFTGDSVIPRDKRSTWVVLPPLTRSVSTAQGAPPTPRSSVATVTVSVRTWLVYSICLIHISLSDSEILIIYHTCVNDGLYLSTGAAH